MNVLKQYETREYYMTVIRCVEQTEEIVSSYQMEMADYLKWLNHNPVISTSDVIPKQYTKDVPLTENFSFNISVSRSY